MYENFTHFGELYCHLVRTAPKEDFLHHKENDTWKSFSKKSFLCSVRYLALAFNEQGWQGKQVAIELSEQPKESI